MNPPDLTPHQAKAFEELTAINLGNQAAYLLEKRCLLAEINAHQLLSLDILRQHVTLYVGSHVDVRFPLLLGCRRITLLDPLFRDVSSVLTVIGIIERTIGRQVEAKLGSPTVRFSFDFGYGEEETEVTCLGQRLGFDDLHDEAEDRLLWRKERSMEWQHKSERRYTSLQNVPEYTPEGPLGMLLGYNPMGAYFLHNQSTLQALIRGGFVLSSHPYECLNPSIETLEEMDEMLEMRQIREGWALQTIEMYRQDGRFDFIPLRRQPPTRAYSFLRKR